MMGISGLIINLSSFELGAAVQDWQARSAIISHYDLTHPLFLF